MMTFLTDLLQRPPATVWDIVDILIVSFVIYELLKLIRGTHAVQMAVSVALLAGVFYLSRGFELETINWLIRNVVGYVVFGAIVLMQADIRRALVHLGQAPLFRIFGRLDRSTTDEETIEELVVATTTLASRRVGTLIVIERAIGLRNYIEGGIPLDARISYDLIVSIFQPASPLHDGAVIIQQDRIAAAACFLPLTVNPQLSRELGSRHRAALGLTEENDAVAIVVSEETGVISLVKAGAIERALSPEQLRARLGTLLLEPQTGRRRFAGADRPH